VVLDQLILPVLLRFGAKNIFKKNMFKRIFSKKYFQKKSKKIRNMFIFFRIKKSKRSGKYLQNLSQQPFRDKSTLSLPRSEIERLMSKHHGDVVFLDACLSRSGV